MKQTVKIESISVTKSDYVTETGEVTQQSATVTVNITPELIAALALPNAGLIEEGWGHTVE